MGHARETWCIYTAEMLCVVSNPVREAFVIYSVNYAYYTQHQAQRKIPVDLHFIVRLRHKASGAALG